MPPHQGRRGFQFMPAGGAKRQITAVRQAGRWRVWIGPRDAEGTVQPFPFETEHFGISTEEQQRLCEALAALCPDCVVEVWGDLGDSAS